MDEELATKGAEDSKGRAEARTRRDGLDAYDAFFGVGVLAEEEGGVAHGADAGDAEGGLDLGDEIGALVAVGALEADFHELAGLEEAGEFALRRGREAGFADLEGGFEGLSEAAQLGLLRAGERDVFHESRP